MIHVDASGTGEGAFLAQHKGEDLVIIAYFSHRFNDSQRHHPATLKECCVVVPLLNAGYIEHVDTMGDRITVLWFHRTTQGL